MSKRGRKSISWHVDKSGYSERLASWIRSKHPSKKEISAMIHAATGIQFNYECVRRWVSESGILPKGKYLGIDKVISGMSIEARRIVFNGTLTEGVAAIKEATGIEYSKDSVSLWRSKRRAKITSACN